MTCPKDVWRRCCGGCGCGLCGPHRTAEKKHARFRTHNLSFQRVSMVSHHYLVLDRQWRPPCYRAAPLFWLYQPGDLVGDHRLFSTACSRRDYSQRLRPIMDSWFCRCLALACRHEWNECPRSTMMLTNGCCLALRSNASGGRWVRQEKHPTYSPPPRKHG